MFELSWSLFLNYLTRNFTQLPVEKLKGSLLGLPEMQDSSREDIAELTFATGCSVRDRLQLEVDFTQLATIIPLQARILRCWVREHQRRYRQPLALACWRRQWRGSSRLALRRPPPRQESVREKQRGLLHPVA